MIGIIAAMDSEVEAIETLLEHKELKHISGIKMIQGTIKNKRVMVLKSGVGKGNAVMATTILLENFRIEKVINIGTAGGLKKEQSILDAVVSTRVVQHDFDTSPIDGEEGIGLYFDADKELCELCEKTLKEMDVCVHCGLVASGDQFIAGENQLTVLEKRFPDAVCAEMEAGAIAQVCLHYHVPFVVLRSLSDIAHKENSHMDFTTYVKHAANRSAEFCKKFIEQL